MNDNKLYTLDELIDNSDFISWVQHGQSKASAWYEYAQGNTPQLAIKQQAIELIELIQFSDDESTIEHHKDKIWANIQANTESEPVIIDSEPAITQTPKSKIRPLYWIGTTAAACLLMLFMFVQGDSNTGSMTIYATDGIVHHSLPDKSSIDITPGSSISYDKKTWTDNREVQLTGEAFFQVQKGKSFTVKNQEATVIVLGTSFNIKESEGQTQVICLTGKVKVIANESKQEDVITANESVIVENTQVRKQTHSKIYIPWQEDEFSFSNVRLKDVFKEIERSFNVNISIDNSYLDQAFNGSFDKSTVDEALHNICWPMKLKYTINDSQVTITSME